MTLVFCGRRNFNYNLFFYLDMVKILKLKKIDFLFVLYLLKKRLNFSILFIYLFFTYFISSRIRGIHIWIKFLIGIRMLYQSKYELLRPETERKCENVTAASRSRFFYLSLYLFPISTSTFCFHTALYSLLTN